jgi:hypothetical protein
MSKRYFTPAEVNALIPELSRVMGALMTAHAGLTAGKAELDGERQHIAMAGGGQIDQATWRRTLDEIARREEEIQRGLEAIARFGGTVKDLGLGLVDFPYLRGGETVNLCWRHGETETRCWHGLDEGYAGRKPL